MALKATLRRAVKAAFKAIDDIPRKVTYNSVSGALVRDLDTGTSTRPTTPYTLPMVAFTKFSIRDIDRDPLLLITDVKLLWPTEDLAPVPKAQDFLVDDKGNKWEVVRLISDPADVLTTVQARTA